MFGFLFLGANGLGVYGFRVHAFRYIFKPDRLTKTCQV